jgi:hypothetical protein
MVRFIHVLLGPTMTTLSLDRFAKEGLWIYGNHMNTEGLSNTFGPAMPEWNVGQVFVVIGRMIELQRRPMDNHP